MRDNGKMELNENALEDVVGGLSFAKIREKDSMNKETTFKRFSADATPVNQAAGQGGLVGKVLTEGGTLSAGGFTGA